MKFHPVAVAALLSAVVLSNSTFAQSAKPLPKKPTASKPVSVQAPAPGSSANIISQRDSLSYSIGVSVAQSMKQQGLTDLNTTLLSQGLNDALKGLSTKLTPEQCQTVVMAYMQKQQTARMAESGKESAANKKIGDAFLAENKTKPGVQTTASGLQYLIEKEGTGPKPTATDKVKVHYTGRTLEGKVFDSSVERGQPIEYPVTGFVTGWIEALQLMPVGSKWKLYIPSNLAYGDRGTGADIKPGATLIFDIELLDIVK